MSKRGRREMPAPYPVHSYLEPLPSRWGFWLLEALVTIQHRQVKQVRIDGTDLEGWRAVTNVLDQIEYGARDGYAYEAYDVDHLPCGPDGNFTGLKAITLSFVKAEEA